MKARNMSGGRGCAPQPDPQVQPYDCQIEFLSRTLWAVLCRTSPRLATTDGFSLQLRLLTDVLARAHRRTSDIFNMDALRSKLHLRHNRKAKSQSQLPYVPPSFGNSQPSSSTLGTSSTLGSWQTNDSGFSNVSLNTNGGQTREYLQAVPENPDAIRRPAELETNRRPTPSMVGFFVEPLRPEESYQEIQQPFIEEEAQLNAAAQQNDAINLRKKSEDEEKRILDRQYNASADNVRRLRELIRERYALDIFVWSKRKITKRLVSNRRTIVPKYQRSDAILQEIYFIVNAWEEDLFSPEEWQIAKKIKKSLADKQLDNGVSNEPAIWDSQPPWEREDDTPPTADMARLRVSPTQRTRPLRPAVPQGSSSDFADREDDTTSTAAMMRHHASPTQRARPPKPAKPDMLRSPSD